MADNVAITAGTGTSIGTDDISGVHYQKMKLYDGTADSTTAVTADSSGLYVRPRPFSDWVQVTSSGLTTASTSYSIGDTLGAILSFTNAAVASGGRGKIVSAVLLDKADVIVDVRLHFFSATVTLASDNAAFAISDADAQLHLGTVQLPTAQDIGNNRVATASGIGLSYELAATTLFVAMETRTAHTFFGAATDLWLALGLDFD